jgi:hypothetical protein
VLVPPSPNTDPSTPSVWLGSLCKLAPPRELKSGDVCIEEADKLIETVVGVLVWWLDADGIVAWPWDGCVEVGSSKVGVGSFWVVSLGRGSLGKLRDNEDVLDGSWDVGGSGSGVVGSNDGVSVEAEGDNVDGIEEELMVGSGSSELGGGKDGKLELARDDSEGCDGVAIVEDGGVTSGRVDVVETELSVLEEELLDVVTLFEPELAVGRVGMIKLLDAVETDCVGTPGNSVGNEMPVELPERDVEGIELVLNVTFHEGHGGENVKEWLTDDVTCSGEEPVNTVVRDTDWVLEGFDEGRVRVASVVGGQL